MRITCAKWTKKLEYKLRNQVKLMKSVKIVSMTLWRLSFSVGERKRSSGLQRRLSDAVGKLCFNDTLLSYNRTILVNGKQMLRVALTHTSTLRLLIIIIPLKWRLFCALRLFVSDSHDLSKLKLKMTRNIGFHLQRNYSFHLQSNLK